MSIGFSFYRWILDPLLFSLRSEIQRMVPKGISLLEIASGTGDLGFRLAPSLAAYSGVEKSLSMVKGSQARLSRSRGHEHMEFFQGDGACLSQVEDKSFDLALISLALHEMPPMDRLPVLNEMKRCANELILVDYASPLPGNIKGRILQSAEFLAGGDHYRGFQDYQSQGGLDTLMKKAGLTIKKEYSAVGRGIRVIQADIADLPI